MISLYSYWHGRRIDLDRNAVATAIAYPDFNDDNRTVVLMLKAGF